MIQTTTTTPLFIILMLLYNTTSHIMESNDNDNTAFSIMNEFSNYLFLFTNTILANSNLDVSQQCNETLINVVTLQDNSVYRYKFTRDSSKMFNDVSSYKDCLFNYYDFSDREIELIKSNMTFIVFYNLDTNFSSLNPQKKKIYGFCLPKGCTELEYSKLFIVASNVLFPDNPHKTIQSFDMLGESTDGHYAIVHMIVYMMPILVIGAFCAFSLCRNFIFKKPYKDRLPLSQNQSIQDKAKVKGKVKDKNRQYSLILFELRECFALNDNCEELMRSTITIYDSNLYNESGLSVITGARAIGMIIVVIGAIFETLALSPLMHSDKHLTHLFIYPSLAFLLFCQRFGKKLCYCISGITLMYKMLNYLDREIEQLEYQANNTNKLLNYQLLPVEVNNESYKHYHSKLHWASLSFFVIRNIYKYILLWFFAIFFKYSFYDFVSIIFERGPLWIYFKKYIVTNFRLTSLLRIEVIQNAPYQFRFSKTNPFNLAINEVNYFTLSILFIFICYKRNWRMDLIILLAIVQCLIGKFIFLYIWFKWYNKNPLQEFYPAKSFLFSVNGYQLKSSPYNLIYYLIGLFFGLINYKIQKPNYANKSKAFLIIPDHITHILQSKVTKVLMVIGVIIILFFPLSHYFLFQWLYRGDLRKVSEFLCNYYVNVFYLYDNEMLMVLSFFVLFRLVFFTESAFIALLKHSYWNCITRPYWLFTVTVYIGANYLLYQNDMKIGLDFKCLVFFSLLGFSIVGISDAVLFILLDVPMKKITNKVIGYYKKRIYKDERSTSFTEHSIN